MRIHYFSRHRWLSVCALCLIVAFLTTGCEPLRKKFTRQKKKDQAVNEKFIPVLEPQEYPAKIYGAQEAYAQHYSLCKVWLSDFLTSFENDVNDKKQIYDLDAALKELGEMQKVLKSPAQDELIKIKQQLQSVRDEFDQPKAFRNASRIKSELRLVDRALRKQFKPELVNESLVGL